MKLDQRLNLVIPVDVGGKTHQVHSQPISADAFEMHYKLIAKTNTQLFNGGYGAISGTRIAAKLMRDISIEMETFKLPGRPAQVGTGQGYEELMAEIRRLTTVITPAGSIMLDEAVGKGVIDDLDRDILENALVFFTVVSAMNSPVEQAEMMRAVCSLWSGEMTSLNSTAFAASLTMSTGKESIGASRVVVDSPVPS